MKIAMYNNYGMSVIKIHCITKIERVVNFCGLVFTFTKISEKVMKTRKRMKYLARGLCGRRATGRQSGLDGRRVSGVEN
jgi:hypothetical protein